MRLLRKDGFCVTFSLMWLFVVFVCVVARPSVLYCVTVVGRTARRGRTRADATRRLLQHFIHSLRVQVLPLPAMHGPAFFAPPPAHTPSRGVRHPSFKVYDRLHHRSPLRFKRWRELCRAPTSPPSFDQRTTRRLPRLWRFPLSSGLPVRYAPAPPFFRRLPPAVPLKSPRFLCLLSSGPSVFCPFALSSRQCLTG